VAIKLFNRESIMSGVVVLLSSKQEVGGIERKAGTTLTVEPHVANSLILRGLATKDVGHSPKESADADVASNVLLGTSKRKK